MRDEDEDLYTPRPWRPWLHGEKVSKERAEYKKGSAFHRCGLCEYMHGQTCEIVAGYIAPYMGCKYFQEKWTDEESAEPTRRR